MIMENQFIDLFNLLTFDCIERCIWLILEEKYPGITLNYLLLMEYKNIKSDIPEELKITPSDCLKLCMGNKQDFFECIDDSLKRNKIILPIDLYYKKEHKMFQNEHYTHYLILSSYDAVQGRYEVIDEDYSKEYGIPKNRQAGMRYCKQYYSRYELYKLCNTVKECFKQVKNFRECEFPYYVLEEKKLLWFENGKILDIYISLLNDMLRGYDLYINKTEAGLYNAYYHLSMKKDAIGEGWIINDIGPWPKEIEGLISHINYMETLKRIYYWKEIKIHNRRIFQAFEVVLEKYNLVKTLIRKFVFNFRQGEIEKIIKIYLPEIAVLEKQLIEDLLKDSENILHGVKS